MLRVTVELVPGGDESRARVLHVAEISNDGKKTAATLGAKGDYNVRLSSRGILSRAFRIGRVTDFPRKRLTAWDLLYRALKNLIGDRNP